MPVTVTATVGATDANSYLSVAAADSIASNMLSTLKWGTATTDDKGKALIAATRSLDQLEWIGTKTSTTQALLWPREEATCGEKDYANNVIPEEIKYSTFDLADALLNDSTLLKPANAGLTELIPGIPNADLKSARVDVLSVDFRDGGAPVVQNALTVLPHLVGILGCLCLSGPKTSVGQISVLRS
jgi:hypothetical protein